MIEVTLSIVSKAAERSSKKRHDAFICNDSACNYCLLYTSDAADEEEWTKDRALGTPQEDVYQRTRRFHI